MKLGLTLEGGANRTVFSCGVLDAFIDQGIKADFIVGTSAGISYGASYATEQRGRNLAIAENFIPDKRYMGFKHMLNPKNRGYFNLAFVFDEIPNSLLPFDYEAFKNFKGDIIAAVTNVETGECEYLPVDRDDKKSMVLRASCALPILFRMIELDGRKYMDGGLSDSIPFEYAIKCGCDKNIVVLTREKGYRKENEKSTGLIEILYRKYPKLVEAVKRRADSYNARIERLLKAEKEGRVFVIRPDDTYGVSRTERDRKKLRMLYDHGYQKAMELERDLKEYINGDEKNI